MADISLSGFKSRVADVARPNRFLLNFSPPSGGDSETLSFLVKGTQLPGRTIGELILNWQGMQAKLAGDPTFEDFTVTFLNDYGMVARTTIENWLRLIANQNSNERASQNMYKTEAIVQQLGRTGEVLGSYRLIGFFPKSLDPIDLNMESSDTVSEFNVTFSIDYFEQI